MKKILIKLTPIILVLIIAISLMIFYFCGLSRNHGLDITEVNLAETATISGSSGCKAAFDKSDITSWSISKEGGEAIVDFGKDTEVNTLLLNEVGYNVKQFSVYSEVGEDWNLIYKSNEMGINRLATFYTISTSKIKIVIDEFNNVAKINDIKVYNIEQREREKELRVTTYITPPSVKAGKIDPDYFDAITDVQFIAYARFDAEGNLIERADEELQMLKDLIGGRNINIFLTIFPPRTETGATMAAIFKDKQQNAIKNIVDSVVATQSAGADFDWEYPSNQKEWNIYSDFIINLKTELAKHDKQLSIADSPWAMRLSKDAIKCIDQLQIMAYDLFDHNGDQCSYAGSVDSAVRSALAKGFKLEQINLGISFYGRPTNAGNVWINYNDPKNFQDEFIMYQQNSWFNTVTTVRDRTVYAILKNIGGIMIFAQDEDLPMSDPLSLTASIGKAKNNFSKAVAK